MVARFAARAVFPLLCLLGQAAYADAIPRYNYKQPMDDGMALVGLECQKKNATLEIGYFYPDKPPHKPMALWKTADLVVHNPDTAMVEKVLTVQRQCKLARDRYKVKIIGVPGARNARWLCGSFATAHATVWKNGRVIFDQDFDDCDGDGDIRTVKFIKGRDKPFISN